MNPAKLKILQFPAQSNNEAYELKKKEAPKIIRQQKRTAEKGKIGRKWKDIDIGLKTGYKSMINALTNEKEDLIIAKISLRNSRIISISY